MGATAPRPDKLVSGLGEPGKGRFLLHGIHPYCSTHQVQADLVGVEAIQSCRGAFCALTTRGVVAWGQGPAAQAPAQAALAARQVQATEGAFAALADGTVVAWGDPAPWSEANGVWGVGCC